MDKKMDKKFYGDVYKIKDHTRVSDDEWICFLAKDDAFYATLPTYLRNCIAMGADATQIAMVEALIARVSAWREANPDRCKVPDAAGEKVLS
jgi:hypothetical protein